MKRLGQDPAFPKDSFTNQYQIGMSRRFYAACAAMQGLLANPANELIRLNADEIATMSLAHADELLKAYDNE